LGIIASDSWEANFGAGAVQYFFFPLGLILLTAGAWVVYYSSAIANSRSSSISPDDQMAAQFNQRKVKRKLLISLYVVIGFLVIFTMVVNFPFILTTTSGCPDDKPSDVSIMTYYFPCNVICSLPSPLSGFTFGSYNLTGGVSATNSSSATAAVAFELNNPCHDTPFFLVSVTLTGYGFSEINRWDSNAQPTSVSNTVPFNSNQNGSSNELISGQITRFIFYPASTGPLMIEKGQLYSLEVKIGVSNSTDGFGTTFTAS
jgi:hypothetical protein